MGKLSNMLNPLSSGRIVTMNQLLEEKPDGFVTVCGFEVRDGKYGRSPIFKSDASGQFEFAGPSCVITAPEVPDDEV